jgi:ornithine cyclodeaminase
MSSAVAVVSGEQVAAALEGKERAILDVVADAYRVHAGSDTVLPHSMFLRFPQMEKERIIALPAYLGGDFRVAGLKWISSFPENVNHGMERASAVLMLNALGSGRVYAILESSVISSVRTAASAALAADVLRPEDRTDSVGIVGCGLISFQILRFLRVLRPRIAHAVVFDIDPARAEQFGRLARERLGVEAVTVAPSLASVFEATRLVSFATTATTPHVERAPIQDGTLILHVSLRDLAPGLILAADNVVDDVDHVCRANTSVHLAEQESGYRGFIRATLGEILTGRQPAAAPERRPFGVFSPFGLGILDLAVGHLAYREAIAQDAATVLPAFHPRPWLETSAPRPALAGEHR